MPFYYYTVKDWHGNTSEGTCEADDLKEAAEYLRSRKYVLLNIDEQQPVAAYSFSSVNKYIKGIASGKQSGRSFMVFCHQFGTMLEAGFTVLRTIRVMGRQMENARFRERLRGVELNVEKGYTLSEAFDTEDGFFPPLLVHMVAAGEAGGFLDEVFRRLADHFERAADLEEKIRSAMIYPLVITLVSLVVLMIMVFFVLPTFHNMFEYMGLDIPFLTRLIMVLGASVANYWHIFLVSVFAAYYAARYYLKKPAGKKHLDRLKLMLPVFAPVYMKIIYARFARTLALLLNSGVDLLVSLKLVERMIDNMVFSRALQQARRDIQDGHPMHTPLRNSGLFRPVFMEMISVGEETGSLVKMLNRSADFYEKQVSYTVDRLKSVIEPFVLIFVGIFVGGMIASLVIPMFQMYEGF